MPEANGAARETQQKIAPRRLEAALAPVGPGGSRRERVVRLILA